MRRPSPRLRSARRGKEVVVGAHVRRPTLGYCRPSTHTVAWLIRCLAMMLTGLN